MTTDLSSARRSRALDRIERLGNRLPDPIIIFLWLILALVALSSLGAALGWSTTSPISGEKVHVESLLLAKHVRKLLTEMPKTMTSFAPLGIVLLIMLGAGVAERVGLLSTAIRMIVRRTPTGLLTPVIVLIGLLANQAADAGFVILVPLAGAVFAAAGRHPIAGMTAAFAGCAGSYSGNPLPGQFDALILGLSEPAAHLIDPAWHGSMIGNWWFSITCGVFLLFSAWFVTDRIIEPRLGAWVPDPSETPQTTISDLERRGLKWAGLAALLVITLWALLALVPDAPLIDGQAQGAARWNPFLKSLTSAFFILFLTAGVTYGIVVRVIARQRDAVSLLSASMASMAPYIVLAFAASHFIALFDWSNLAPFVAVEGAAILRDSGLPIPFVLAGLVVITIILDFFIGSASAKWAALAPVFVPMMMIMGVSPEMTTATYRVGDTSVNMCTPLMVYFPLVLAHCQRWKPDFGVGSLLALMAPYALVFTLSALAIVTTWAAFELPPGPGASFHYSLPTDIRR